MHAYLNIATKVIREVSKVLLRGYDNLESTPEKRDQQIIKLREKLEAKIYTALLERYPRHEFAFPGLTIKNEAETVWHIDVLSGEANFRRGIPHFAMVITINEKNKPQHALVFDPILQEMFTVTKNASAQINNQRIRISSTQELEEAMIGSNFNFDHENLRRTGCPALLLAYVANGRLDGFVGRNLSYYDITAGSLMVKVCGGMFADFQGDTKHEETGELVAATPKLFKALLQITK